jgi:hypothetical protein
MALKAGAGLLRVLNHLSTLHSAALACYTDRHRPIIAGKGSASGLAYLLDCARLFRLDSVRACEPYWFRRTEPTQRVGANCRKLPRNDTDLCGIAELRDELFAVFPREAECAHVRTKPYCSHEGADPNERVNAPLSCARHLFARPG